MTSAIANGALEVLPVDEDVLLDILSICDDFESH